MLKPPLTLGAPLRLPEPLQRGLDGFARAWLEADTDTPFDFSRPRGEPALIAPDSVSWRVFKNPATLFIGGVAAVILELAEPSVRSGVWEHSGFRTDPVRRLRRTGMAAMVSIYGPRSQAEPMIAGVVRRHDQVSGQTPAGRPYRANDPELLRWVLATASYGFGMAYSRYARALGPTELRRLHEEAVPAGRLYGVAHAPRSAGEVEALFQATAGRLEPSDILFDFLRMMRRAPAFPGALRPLQALYVRAAVSLVPPWIRARLDLGAAHGLRPGEGALVRLAAGATDRVLIRSSPAVQACLRLGLPEDYLYRGRA